MFLLIFLFAYGTLFAGEPTAAQKDLHQDLLGPVSENSQCQAALKDLSEFRLLLVLPEFEEFVASPKKKSAELQKKLGTWSSDLLLQIVLEIETRFLPRCPDAKTLGKTAEICKRAYLSKIGIPEAKVAKASTEELNDWFHGLVMLKEDVPSFEEKIAKSAKARDLQLLKAVYGEAVKFQNVLILSSSPSSIKGLKSVVETLCKNASSNKSQCPFWDPIALWKVVLTDDRGVAAYVPEILTLAVSKELVEDPNTLMRIVLAHELAHSAQTSVWSRDREKWLDSFEEISGWKEEKSAWDCKVEKLKQSRQDFLTELSKGSAYSILPDDLYRATEGKKDGFVFSKSYTESKKRDDPSEDLCDSIAAFVYAKDRFCLDGKPFAPAKYEWVRQYIFPKESPLFCAVKN